MTSKRKSQSPPESESSNKIPKVVPEPSLPATDTVKESVESDDFPEPSMSLSDSMKVDDSLLDASYQEPMMRQLDAGLKSAELSWAEEDEQNSALAEAASEKADTSKSDSVLAQPGTPGRLVVVDQLAASHFDEAFFEDMMCSESLGLSRVSHHLEVSAASQDEVGLPSPTSSPSTSSSEPEEMSSPTPFSSSLPPACCENIVDYRDGQPLPNSYVTSLRRQVDEDFTNDNWGDEHYFGDPAPFRYHEDITPDSIEKINKAINKGLKCLAARIPEQSRQKSWRKFELSLDKPGIDDRTEDEESRMFEEMLKRIQARISLTDSLSLPLELEQRVQDQNILHSLNPMQGVHPASRVAFKLQQIRSDHYRSFHRALTAVKGFGGGDLIWMLDYSNDCRGYGVR